MDQQYFIPQRITVYEFDVDKANSNPSANPTEFIKVVRKYPDDLGVASLAPGQLSNFISSARNSEAKTLAFMR